MSKITDTDIHILNAGVAAAARGASNEEIRAAGEAAAREPAGDDPPWIDKYPTCTLERMKALQAVKDTEWPLWDSQDFLPGQVGPGNFTPSRSQIRT